MAESSTSFFDEDEVSAFIVEKGVYKCGLVMQSAEYSSDEDDEDNDNDLFEKVKPGTARIVWHPHGEEEVVPVTRLTLEDRSLMPGDVVRRLVAGQDSQRGYVISTAVQCNVQVNGTNFALHSINSKDLELLLPWDLEPGDVCLDSWIGKVNNVSEILHLKLPDGTVFRIDCDIDEAADLLEDIHQQRDVDTEFYNSVFYEGQMLKISLMNIMKNLKREHPKSSWIKRPGSTDVICVVEKVEIKRVEVYWVCRGYAQADNTEEFNHHPPRRLKPEQFIRLKNLDCFRGSSFQIGDNAFYTVKSDDLIHTIEDTSVPYHNFRSHQNHVSESAENSRNMQNCPAGGLSGSPTATSGSGDLESQQEPLSQQGAELSSAQNKMKLARQSDNQDSGNSQKSKSGRSTKDPSKVSNKKSTGKDKEIIADTPAEICTSSCSEPMELLTENSIDVSDENPDKDAVPFDQSGKSSDADDTEFDPVEHEKTDAVAAAPRSGFNVRSKKLMRGLRSRKSRAAPQLVAPPMHRQAPTPGERVAVEIFCTKSLVNVMWQDGTRECNVKSSELYPIHHLDQLEFFPGDYVIPSGDNVDPNVYGVVEAVNHSERTCRIRWLKPYQVGQSNRPDEQIMSEEVSVYDITDHPSYKFRPGHVVVRVGGYESDGSRNLSAAGQVYELGKDGRILIQWADSTQSYCYPQEVFLVDELSELEDSLNGSDSDSSLGSQNSDDSWETEEEEEGGEEEAAGLQEESAGGGFPLLVVEACQKVDLDHTMNNVMSGLQEVERRHDKDWFAQYSDSVPLILEELLRIHQQCRYLDRTLKATYFKDSKLATIIQAVRGMLSIERKERQSRHVRNVFLTNTGREQEEGKNAAAEGGVGNSTEVESAKANSPNGEIKETQGSETREEKETKTSNIDETSEQKNLEHSNVVTEGVKSSVTEGGEQNSSSAEAGNQTSSATDIEVDADAELDTESNGTEDDSDSSPTNERVKILRKVHAALDQSQEYGSLLGEVLEYFNIQRLCSEENQESESVKHDDSWIQAIVEEPGHTVILLVKLCCRCLSTVMKRLRSDLNQKWEDLKVAGKLKILEDMDEESSDTADGRDTPSAESFDKKEVTEEPPQSIQSTPQKTGLSLDLTASKNALSEPLQTPMTPQTPADVLAKLDLNKEGFTLEDEADETHKFFKEVCEPSDPKAFNSAVRKEIKLLKTGLPNNIFVKGFSNRMDLYSVMMLGPASTPYQDGLFFFDIQLPQDYPVDPPRVHYIAFCSDRLNPNLYEDGKVCVSLLGTWMGKGTEVWSAKSSLLQVLISIQGLILVPEPYYNEAGYEKQKGSQHGIENSRMYNEMAVLKMIESMTRITTRPPVVWAKEAKQHITENAPRMIARLDSWLDVATGNPELNGPKTSASTSKASDAVPHSGSTPGGPEQGCASDSGHDKEPASREDQESVQQAPSTSQRPDFPLFPLSKGLQITLRKHLTAFKSVLPDANVPIRS